MRVEVLCTGDELLGGAVSDTNTAAFARLLLDVGVEVQRATVVGDDQGDIEAALKEVCARADVVILSGGLGPTQDDRTTAAVAAVMGVSLCLDEMALGDLTARLARFNRPLGDNNRKQALFPQGARVLRTQVGTAAGFCVGVGGAQVYVTPGVPQEAEWFGKTYVVPELAAHGAPGVLRTATLRCVGIAESVLDEKVKHLEGMFPGVSVHFRTVFPENHLKLVARGMAVARVEETLTSAVSEATRVLGGVVVSQDGRSLAAVVRDALLRKSETVAVAESCTGGWITKLLSDEPGSSQVLVGGVVAYSNAVKMTLLSVTAETLQQHGAVSEAVATQMAVGVRERLGAHWGLSVTGVAGPEGGTPQKPVGTVHMAVSGALGTQAWHHVFPWDRERNRHAAVATALVALLGKL